MRLALALTYPVFFVLDRLGSEPAASAPEEDSPARSARAEDEAFASAAVLLRLQSGL